MDKEEIEYSLLFDSERSSLFFVDTVLICEGATEKFFIDHLIKTKWDKLKEKSLYVLDSMGKYNFHKYMNLFEALGIYHSILADEDENKNKYKPINKLIKKNKNKYTKGIHFFNKDLEDFLGITTISPNKKKYDKPKNILLCYRNNEISQDKINELEQILEKIIGS